MIHVSHPWDSIDLAPDQADPWKDLDVPEERNQRFFVKSQQEFGEHLQAT